MLAIIGGTGLSQMSGFESVDRETIQTPYADEAVQMEVFATRGSPLVFLPRHGSNHVIPPHRINYRANIWALHKLGVEGILAINAVGGIHPELPPGAFAVPDQIIDYTHCRANTFFEDDLESVTHIDFTYPFDAALRQQLLAGTAAANARRDEQRAVLDGAVYGCLQGPRLETAAEIRRLKQDGCDLVGMTAMPEAALARELELPYAMLALSVNWAAGLAAGEITMAEMETVVAQGMQYVIRVLDIVSATGQ